VLGLRAVRQHGALAGLALIRKRTRLCGITHRRFRKKVSRPLSAQHGVCDIGCDFPGDAGCDLPSGRGVTKFFDVIISCCDCGGCDWPQRRSRSKEREKSIYIPPKTKSRTGSSSFAP
jgi:uncharacterized protein